MLTSLDSSETSYAFTGEQYDPLTGLVYLQARYYSTSLGKFVQADTIVFQPGNAQAWDRFTYVQNNPIRFTDPKRDLALNLVQESMEICRQL